jgi:protease-4
MLAKLGRGMFRLLAALGAVVGLFAIVSMVLLAVYWPADPAQKELPKKIILSVALMPGLAELNADGPFQKLFSNARLSLFEIVRALDVAAEDDRVKGVFVNLTYADFGLAEAQELRAAISRLRAGGKVTHVFAESFDRGGAVGPYYLASAFDTVSMQPSGLLAITGVSLDLPLLGEALRSQGITPQFSARHEYKGAMASLTEATLPAPIRENLQKMLRSLFNQITAGIARARRQSPDTIATFIDNAPLLAREAKASGLVDQLHYQDQAWTAARKASDGAQQVFLKDYAAVTEAKESAQEAQHEIAVVALTGAIVGGGSRQFNEGDNLSSGYVRRVLDKVRKNKAVRAVVLRIDSPGGSYIAADSMLREIMRLREAGKTVVVSMADVAASGGFFLSLGADHVVAQPASVTGSIGVVGGKVVIGDLLAKFKGEATQIAIGRNAGMFSPLRPFTNSQNARMTAILDNIYDDFTRRTQATRRLTDAEIDAAARGRVWTGEAARQVGLIDGLGGYREAINLARLTMGLAADETVKVAVYPRDLGSSDALLEMIQEGGLDQWLDVISLMMRFRETFGAIVDVMQVDHQTMRLEVDLRR